MIHAAGESSPGNLPSNTHAVALAIANESELLRLEAKLQDHSIEFVAIREPDAPWNGQLMAIGLKPAHKSATLKKCLSHLKLVK